MFLPLAEHQNWFGIDETLGPVAISIKKEKVEENCVDKNHSVPSYQYRFIFRTSEVSCSFISFVNFAKNVMSIYLSQTYLFNTH